MKVAVEQAVDEIRNGLPGHEVRMLEDTDGGAYVIVEGMNIGDSFAPSVSWIGFQITWSYPDADVYPHFIDASVTYVGVGATPNTFTEGNLPTSMTRGSLMPGFEIAAIQISRRSNRRNAFTDTALQKLIRVVESLRSR
jgi:hypothetical protein